MSALPVTDLEEYRNLKLLEQAKPKEDSKFKPPTYNPNKDRFVDPIRSLEDVEKCKEYLLNILREARTETKILVNDILESAGVSPSRE